jgi:hypothetical protein
MAGGRSLHGKEGVDGSSPSEGLTKFLLISSFCRLGWRQFWASTSTERPPRAGIVSGEALERCWGGGLRALSAASTQRPRRSELDQAARADRYGVTQSPYHPGARAYLERKQAEGKSRREAMRCLKRLLIRVVFNTLKASPALT